MHTVVRAATDDDVPQIVDLMTGLWREDSGERDPFMDQGWPARSGAVYYGGVLRHESYRCWVAEVDGVVAGVLIGRIEPPGTIRPVRVADLESMYVRPGYRSHGVGAVLVTEFLGWARERGSDRASVTAYATNDKAIAFYQRQGFAPLRLTLEAPVNLSGAGRRRG